MRRRDEVAVGILITIAIAILVLSFFAALAGFIPARRAASIAPMTALRIE